jgi:NADP-dependent 3-hydroxy acid dehydrogenase YdfG
VYAQFIKGTKGLSTKYDEWGDVEVTKKEQVLEVIDSLPLTWQQKDALYLAAGYAESEIWNVPW